MESNPIIGLYSILHGEVLPFADQVLDSQLANLVRLMEGLVEGRSVHLSRIASNVDVRGVYEPIARELLRQAAAAGRLILIMDCTKVGFSAQLMMVSLA